MAETETFGPDLVQTGEDSHNESDAAEKDQNLSQSVIERELPALDSRQDANGKPKHESDDSALHHDPTNDDDAGHKATMLKETYALKTIAAEWYKYDTDYKDFNISGEYHKIRDGWNREKQHICGTYAEAMASPPTRELLREMQKEKRDRKLDLCTDTMEFNLWMYKSLRGQKIDGLEIDLSSLQRTDQQNKDYKARAKATIHNARLEFFKSMGIRLTRCRSAQERLEYSRRRFRGICQQF